jgi:hypothetical protein
MITTSSSLMPALGAANDSTETGLEADRIKEARQLQKQDHKETTCLRNQKGGPAVVALRKIPTPEEQLKEDEIKRLCQIATGNVRSFEIQYESNSDSHSYEPGFATILLSSCAANSREDLEGVYIPQLEAVYGKLDYEFLYDTRPRFVTEELPKLLFVA